MVRPTEKVTLLAVTRPPSTNLQLNKRMLPHLLVAIWGEKFTQKTSLWNNQYNSPQNLFMGGKTLDAQIWQRIEVVEQDVYKFIDQCVH